LKKFSLILVMLALMLVPTFAATSANTVLQATIGAELSITSTLAGITVVNPTLTSTTLGNVIITSNISSWAITIGSANGGKMKFGAQEYPYLFNFGLVTGINLATNYVVNKTTPQSATTTALAITYATGASLGLLSGTYEDTLTVTLSAI